MSNKRKITFNSEDLKEFIENKKLVIREDSLSRIEGGMYNQYLQKAYADTTFVNNIIRPIFTEKQQETNTF